MYCVYLLSKKLYINTYKQYVTALHIFCTKMHEDLDSALPTG
jgi:hypothetical protein